MKFKAFTLAEIMIVLTIIGILTAILLPIAINSAPDENVMKFKKGNNTLGTVIRELVNSDQYYLNGFLAKNNNNVWLDQSNNSNFSYFCNSMADVLNVKQNNCNDFNEYSDFSDSFFESQTGAVSEDHIYFNGKDSGTGYAARLDNVCKSVQSSITKPQFITTDDISFYESSAKMPFGVVIYNKYRPFLWLWDKQKVESSNYYKTKIDEDYIKSYGNKFLYFYKVFCMDIDGINKGEDPFGYGIRVDGKILYGARAEEWLKKSIQKGE